MAELQNILRKKLMARRETETESHLKQKALVGTLASRRAGLGYLPNTQVGNAQEKKPPTPGRGLSRDHAPKKEVNFIKAGEEPEILAKSITGLLHSW